MLMTEKFNVCKLTGRLYFNANKRLKQTNSAVTDLEADKLTLRKNTQSQGKKAVSQKYTSAY